MVTSYHVPARVSCDYVEAFTKLDSARAARFLGSCPWLSADRVESVGKARIVMGDAHGRELVFAKRFGNWRWVETSEKGKLSGPVLFPSKLEKMIPAFTKSAARLKASRARYQEKQPARGRENPAEW